MRSPRVHKEFGSFAVLLLGGVFLGNILLALLSLVPLLFVAISHMYGAPGRVKITRKAREIEARRGEEAVLSSRLEVEDGVGMVTVEQEVPAPFELASGSNFRTFWKGPGPLAVEMSFAVRCAKRGVYHTGRFRDERVHFSGLKRAERGRDDGTVEITVRLPLDDLKGLKDPRLLSRVPLPSGAVSKLGPRTTEFQEIRPYAPGDQYRNINWKATVRSGRDETDPLVNDFEREGKKTAWIFLDGRPFMRTGSATDDAFEHGVQAASALSSFYLARGCEVGLHVLGTGKTVPPDAGRRQEGTIGRALVEAEPSGDRETLEQALEQCQGHWRGKGPLVVLITMVREENVQELRAAMGRMAVRWGQGTKVAVIHICGHRVAADGPMESLAAEVLDLGTLPWLRSLGAAGAMVYSWDPRRQNIISLMLQGALV